MNCMLGTGASRTGVCNVFSLSAETAQLRPQRFRNIYLKRKHPRRQRLAIVIEAEAARYTTAKRAFGDEVERLQSVDFITCDLAGDDTRIVRLELVRGELLLEVGIQFRSVCKDCNVRSISLVTRAGVGKMLEQDFHFDRAITFERS